MTIFHIKYPRRRGFLKWDELGCDLYNSKVKYFDAISDREVYGLEATNNYKGCLARALGFQVELFRDSVTDEISVENDGIHTQEVMKMLDYRLLYKGLHLTVNMHTAEWNMAAIRKAIMLLAHKALTFEEIHNVRVAYQLYEAGDMKGMNLDKHTLLRSLKMCGRTIAPLKLMHRIKHMKEDFEEVGRIQLSEYFDLILWCDLYHGFNPKDMEYPEGKENKLFKLVDFEKLLSHHDDRVAWALNRQYLREEWDFGQETLGSKQMFREPPITNEARIQQTRLHKRKYRHLKHEVGCSQKRVYRAHAGYIRDRPITAPDLSMYHPKEVEEKVTGTTAQEVYQSVRRRLKSAPPSSRASLYEDRPSTQQYQRQLTPKAVTTKDLSDVEKKMDSLKFDMITLDSKYEIDKDEKMDYFLPGYREKLAKRPPPVPYPEPEPEPPKPVHWTEEVIEQLVHPPFRLPPSHARKCDARYRGWHAVKCKKGPHFVLVASSYENSPQGQMFRKLKERTFGPVKHIHREHLFRYTSSTQVERGKGRLAEERPVTAPAMMQTYRNRSGRGGSSSSSSLQNGVYRDPPTIAVTRAPSGSQVSPVAERQEEVRITENREDTRILDSRNMLGSDVGYESLDEEQKTDLPLTKKNVSDSQIQFSKSEMECSDEGFANSDSLGDVGGQDVEIPVPPMQHSKPKIVEVGHIGTISLLEKIDESQDLEDRFSQTSQKHSEIQDAGSDTTSKGDELRKSFLSSPSPSKFNQEHQKSFTVTSETLPHRGPSTAQIRVPETSTQIGSTDFGDGDDDSTISLISESRPESFRSESRAEPAGDGIQTKTLEKEVDEKSLNQKRCPDTSKQVQIDINSGRETETLGSAKSGSSRSSSSPSKKRRHQPGSFQRSASMNMNKKYFRLVQRVSSSISHDLQTRLLAHK